MNAACGEDSTVGELMADSTPNKIIIVGLGEVAMTHIKALERLGQTVMAGVDTDMSKQLFAGGKPLPVYRSPSEVAQAYSEPDIVVVATPTPNHYATCQEVFSAFANEPRVLVEKPCADSLEEVVDLAAQPRLEMLLHYAYTPEVLWAKHRLPGWLYKHGPIEYYQATAADPRSTPDQAQRRAVLGSSWHDLGINVLSAVQRLVDITDIQLDPVREPYDYAAITSFRSDSAVGTGTIATQWSVRSSAYNATFMFTDGAQLHLNHYLVSGAFEDGDGVVQSSFTNDGTPRRLSHYLNLYHDLLGSQALAVSKSDGLKLHQLLLAS